MINSLYLIVTGYILFVFEKKNIYLLKFKNTTAANILCIIVSELIYNVQRVLIIKLHGYAF